MAFSLAPHHVCSSSRNPQSVFVTFVSRLPCLYTENYGPCLVCALCFNGAPAREEPGSHPQSFDCFMHDCTIWVLLSLFEFSIAVLVWALCDFLRLLML